MCFAHPQNFFSLFDIRPELIQVQLTHILRSPLETLSPWAHCTGINFGGKFFHQQWRLLCLLRLNGVHPQRVAIWCHGCLAPRLLRVYPDLQSLTFHAISCSANPDGGLNRFSPVDELRTFLNTVLHFKHLRSLTVEKKAERRFFDSYSPKFKHFGNSPGLSLVIRWHKARQSPERVSVALS